MGFLIDRLIVEGVRFVSSWLFIAVVCWLAWKASGPIDRALFRDVR